MKNLTVQRRTKPTAFTLTVLLVVVSIIVLLVSILLPASENPTSHNYSTSADVESNKAEIMQMQRNLKNYRNSTGQPPDSLDNGIDDTAAFLAAFAEGPGVVHIPPGFYRCGNVTIPPKVTLQGAGPATVIRLNDGAERIFTQVHVNEWKLRDVFLDGMAEGDWRTREDLDHTGIYVSTCIQFEISGVTVANFSGPGIYLIQIYTAAPWQSNARLFNITAKNNYIGIHFDERAEYISASMLGCETNRIGCLINSGNVNITNSHFTSNLTGVRIEDKNNGSHGCISNSLITHNEQYSLFARNVLNGMAISNCAFYGDIRIEDSVGVNISSGRIAANVSITGTKTNRIAGNYIDPSGWSFTFSPSTIVEDNFTENGSWDANR